MFKNAVLAALKPGDLVTVESTDLRKPRTLVVTAVAGGYVYVTSGKPYPGNFRGGSLTDKWGPVQYQPTLAQRPVNVSSLTRVSCAAA